MKKWLSVILLLLVSTATFADTTNIAPHAFSTTSGDLSMSYLAQIFGTVGNTLHGNSGQFLGKIFDIFNKGVLFAAALYLAYVIGSVALRSAHDGSFMGHNKNVAFLFLRIAAAFALAIPLPSTGYSALQVILMKVVHEGVGLADNVWGTELKYLKNGGTIYIAPQNNQISVKEADNILTQSKQVFVNEVCTIESGHYNSQLNNESTPSNGSSNNSSPYINSGSGSINSYDLYYDQNANTVYFPGLGNSTNYQPYNNGVAVVPNCGMARGFADTSGNNQNNSILQGYSWASMQQLVTDLLPAAHRYVCMQHPNWSSCDDVTVDKTHITNENQQDFLNSLVDYINLISPYARYLQNQVNENDNPFNHNDTNIDNDAQFIGDGTTNDHAWGQGWASAGMYYWNIIQLNNDYQRVSVANDLPSVSGYTTIVAQNADLQNDLTVAASDSAGYVSTVVNTLLNQYNNNQSGSGGSGIGGSPSTGGGVAGAIFSLGLSKIVKLFYDFQNINPNPVVFLATLGQDCLSAAFYLWIGGLAIILPISFVMGICNSSSPTGVVLKEVVSWLKPLILFITGLLFVPGILLGYYVPLFPFIVFTFAVIGWLVSVVEAMLAMPLVCFGLTHPEGHDFLGRAEQFFMMLLLVFLRPVLLIIGFSVWMLISYVGFNILIFGFETVLQNIFGSFSTSTSSLVSVAYAAAHTDSSGLLVLVTAPVLLALLALVSYSFVKFTAPIITDVSRSIGQWIGMSDNHSLINSAASSAGEAESRGMQVASSAQGAARSVGAGTTAMGEYGATNKGEQLGKKMGTKGWQQNNNTSGGAGGGTGMPTN